MKTRSHTYPTLLKKKTKYTY